MDFDYTPQEQSFREEVRGFIAEHLPPKEERDKNFLAPWREKVRAKVWVGFAWPKEFGGSDGGRDAATTWTSRMSGSAKARLLPIAVMLASLL